MLRESSMGIDPFADPFTDGVFADAGGNGDEEFRRWHTTIRMIGRLAAGVPSNPEAMEGWIRKNAGVDSDEEVAQYMLKHLRELGHDVNTTDLDALRQVSEEVAATMHTNVFRRDEHGLYIGGYQVMAMLKESVSVLYKGVKWGHRPLRKGTWDGGLPGKAAVKHFPERVHVPNERIYLERGYDTDTKREADGTELQLVHLEDRPSSMHYVEYVDPGTRLSFVVEEFIDKKIPTNRVPEEEWLRIWRHAQRNGLGAMRSMQWGKFVVESWEEGR